MTLHLRPSVALSCRRLLPLALLCATSQMLVAQTLKHHTDQSAAPAATAATAPDHAASYYHYGLAHLYEDLAVNAGLVAGTKPAKLEM